MKVTLIAKPQWCAPPDMEQVQRCRPDQLQGTDGEKVAEFAGRLCYDSFGRGRDSDAFAANILESGHVNVLYHAHFVLLVEGVSRNLSHELVRHHVGFSPSQRSTRYCDERDSPLVHHPELGPVDELPGALQVSLMRLDAAWRATYADVVTHMMDLGRDRKTAQGAAARYLPNGVETELVWSGNAGAFLQMLPRRSIPKVVDAEFVDVAREMWRVMREQMPAYFTTEEPCI